MDDPNHLIVLTVSVVGLVGIQPVVPENGVVREKHSWQHVSAAEEFALREEFAQPVK